MNGVRHCVAWFLKINKVSRIFSWLFTIWPQRQKLHILIFCQKIHQIGRNSALFGLNVNKVSRILTFFSVIYNFAFRTKIITSNFLSKSSSKWLKFLMECKQSFTNNFTNSLYVKLPISITMTIDNSIGSWIGGSTTWWSCRRRRRCWSWAMLFCNRFWRS